MADRTERAIGETMRSQYGVIGRLQALSAGLTPDQVHRRLDTGEWIAAFRAVYRSASSPLTCEQRLMAALLAAGPGAVVSHASASWVWGLQSKPPGRPSLTVPPWRHPRLDDVEIHRLDDLDPQRVSHWKGFECTDPLRTLVDLAAVARTDDVADAVYRALSNGLVNVQGLEAELGRRAAHGRRGVKPLRELLHARAMIGAPPPSVLEVETLALLARFRIPVLGREVHAGPDGRYRVDIALPPPVVVEVDGYAFHWSPEAKARDEARRNSLRLEGMFLLVYTWRDIRNDGRRVGREVRSALSRFGTS